VAALVKVSADATLDASGLFCPLPIVKAAKKIKELAVGQVLEVIATDPGIQVDLPAWCKSTGHELLGIEEWEGKFWGYVRKAR